MQLKRLPPRADRTSAPSAINPTKTLLQPGQAGGIDASIATSPRLPPSSQALIATSVNHATSRTPSRGPLARIATRRFQPRARTTMTATASARHAMTSTRQVAPIARNASPAIKSAAPTCPTFNAATPAIFSDRAFFCGNRRLNDKTALVDSVIGSYSAYTRSTSRGSM